MDVAAVVRSMRRLAVLSQRELADRSGVPRSTVERIESGCTKNPGILTVVDLAEAAECSVRITDAQGGEVARSHPDEELRDRGSRHYPAHLELYTPGWMDEWWGWCRIAWWMEDPVVPKHVYYRRDRR